MGNDEDRITLTVQEFLSTRKTQSTREVYKSGLVDFGLFCFGDKLAPGKTIGSSTSEEVEMLLNAVSGLVCNGSRGDIFRKLLQYRSNLATKGKRTRQIAPRSQAANMTAVRSYVGSCDIEFSKKMMNDLKIDLTQEPTDDDPFTHDSALKVYGHLSGIGRGLYLFLLASGCRIGEAVTVTRGNVDWSQTPVLVKIAGKTTKTKKGRDVFITDETARYLKDIWLAPSSKEGLSARDRYMIAASHKGRGLPTSSGKRPDIQDDDRLFPIDKNTASRILTLGIKKAGFTERNEFSRLKLHTHSTRKFFRTSFGRIASPDAAEQLMGHSPNSLTATYRRLDTDVLKAEYLKAQPALTIQISSEARLALITGDTHAEAIVQLERKNKELEAEVGKIRHIEKMIQSITGNPEALKLLQGTKPGNH